MAVKVGQFQTTTQAAGTQVAVTGVGFQPDIVFFQWSGTTDQLDGSVGGNVVLGLGVAKSPTERFALGMQRRDPSQDNGWTFHRNDSCIAIEIVAGDVGRMDLASMDSDGFTLDIDDAFGASYNIKYMAIKSGFSWKVGSFQEPASTGNQSITGVGFQPTTALFFSACKTFAPPYGPEGGKGLMVGAARSSSSRYVSAITTHQSNAGLTNASGSAWVYTIDSECIAFLMGPSTGGMTDGRADFVSMDSDGFTINWLERASTRYVFYVATNMPSTLLGDLLTQTDTVTDIVESGFGFQPEAIMMFSTCMAKQTADVPASGSKSWSMGLGTGATSRFATGAFFSNFVNDLNAQSARSQEADEIYVNTADGSYLGFMDIKSVDSGGYTFIMDDADPSQSFAWYLAFLTGVVYTQSVGGTLTFAGGLVRQTNKLVAGTLTFLGTLTSAVAKILRAMILGMPDPTANLRGYPDPAASLEGDPDPEAEIRSGQTTTI